jgi:hypothetical protein
MRRRDIKHGCDRASLLCFSPAAFIDRRHMCSPLLHSVAVVGRLILSPQAAGPARALTDPLRQGPPVTALLDGLTILTRIRLPRVANGPDVMPIGVVFPGTGPVLILSKSSGRDRPQYRVTKPTGLRGRGL